MEKREGWKKIRKGVKREREERAQAQEVKQGKEIKVCEYYGGSGLIPAGLLCEKFAIGVLMSQVCSKPQVMLLLLQVR